MEISVSVCPLTDVSFQVLEHLSVTTITSCDVL